MYNASFRVRTFALMSLCLLPLTAGPAAAEEDRYHPAIKGYDPTSYFTQGKAVKGDPNIKAEYFGKVYYFASEDAKKTFLENPGKYQPMYDGYCAASMGGIKELRNEPDPETFYIHDGKLYLFVGERYKKVFVKSTDQFISKANERFQGAGGYCPVAMIEQKKTIKGDPAYRMVYNGYGYQFSSEEALKKFQNNPDRYIPQYGGYCAEGMSRGKKFPSDKTVFAILDGRAFFFWDEKMRDKFLADKETMIANADKHWQEIKSGR